MIMGLHTGVWFSLSGLQRIRCSGFMDPNLNLIVKVIIGPVRFKQWIIA